MPEIPLLRSYLYAPGTRPELLAKAYRAGADAVIFDLEDAVAPAEKGRARRAVADAIGRLAGPAAAPDPTPPRRRPQLHVRINRGPGGYDEPDLAAVAIPGLDGLRLPKAVDPDEVRWVGDWLDALEDRTGRTGRSGAPCLLYPTVESAAGVLRAGELAAAHPRVARLGFGAADFLADIGAPPDAGPGAAWWARSQLVLCSRAVGIAAPADGAYPRLDDDAGLRAAARNARELGFSGQSVIHPRQLRTVHQVFTPGPDEVAAARRLVAAFDAAGRDGAALRHEGGFVDPAVVARARKLLELAAAVAALDHQEDAR